MSQLLQFAQVEAIKRANNKVGTVLLDTLYIVLLLVTPFYVNGNVTFIRNATQVLIAITALTFILPVYYLYILIRLAVLVYITRIAFIIHNMLVIRDWVM